MNQRIVTLFFLLAAFTGWLPNVRAALPTLQENLEIRVESQLAVQSPETWELVEVQPFGFTDDGTPLALFVFVELPDAFDMFSPVSTRAGPETHTRVLYVVQPVLGLEPISSAEAAQMQTPESLGLTTFNDTWFRNFSLSNIPIPYIASTPRVSPVVPEASWGEKWAQFKTEWRQDNLQREVNRILAQPAIEEYWRVRQERGFLGNRADDWNAYWDWASDHKIQAVASWYMVFRLAKPGPQRSYAGTQSRAAPATTQPSLRIRSTTTTNPQYLPVVYDPAFAQAQLGNISWLDLYLYRSSSSGAFTFRGDSRGFNVIFDKGFSARGTSQDVFSHAVDNWNPPSAYVSTTTSPSVAASFGDDLNIYIVRPRYGLDVNHILGPRSPYPHELEIAVPWRIRPFDIRGVTLPQEGVSILNPNWLP